MKRALYFIQRQVSKLLAITICSFTWISCDNILDNGYGDCTSEFRVKFKYDYNMKKADAFASEVKSVTLYFFDDNGEFVYQRTEQGDMLAEDDYTMPVEVEPGDYHLVSWAGLEGEESFSVPILTEGLSTIDELTCRMNRENITRAEDGSAVVRNELKPLFHGEVTKQSFGSRAGRTEIITVPLVKNTNDIVVNLQQYSDNLDMSQFEVKITDDNGLMAYNNNLLADETLTYMPYDTLSYTHINGDGQADISQISNVKAQLTVGRLMVDKHPRLTVTNKNTGSTVLSIPLTECLVMGKPETAACKNMTNQEYLDRQDIYNMTFLLDDNLKWVNTEININGWIVRYNQIKF